MKTISQISNITKVSVRTLHYYDEIGLLKPTVVTQAGYRMYDDTALEKMQEILLFKELEFSLKDIKLILDNDDFDKDEAIKHQITLLKLRINHLNKLVKLAENIRKEKGKLDFSAFDKKEIEMYEKEAKEKWGRSKAYKEYESKNKNRNKEDMLKINEGLMNIFKEFGALKDLHVDDETVREKVISLKEYISENYYKCTNEILMGLGEMYVLDERMKFNIDKFSGSGTCEFVNKAIKEYLK